MRTYNKLVRDKIPQINKEKGIAFKAITLSHDEYKVELNKKLKEEADEYLADSSLEELADLQEVIYAILDERNISKEDFESNSECISTKALLTSSILALFFK